MGDVVRLVINDQPQEVTVQEFRGQRVVTLRQIDELHHRPEGTARRNFNENRSRFIEGTDYFVRNPSEARDEFGVIAPNGLVLVTESGYLMLVKSFTDDLAWTVQRQLVNNYFRAKQTVGVSQLLALRQTLDVLEEQERRLSALESRQREAEAERAQQTQQLTVLDHRVNNLDLTNIEGTPRQRLVAMIKRYAHQNGITYQAAWREFDNRFNTAFHTNLTTRRNNYTQHHNLRKLVDRPEYLEARGQIEDAIRVADKMLNTQQKKAT